MGENGDKDRESLASVINELNPSGRQVKMIDIKRNKDRK